ncbi:hypothetical protein J3F84DRAFT_358452, partial [Trichoderma pleuroticola]
MQQSPSPPSLHSAKEGKRLRKTPRCVLVFFAAGAIELSGPSRSAPSADTPGGRRWRPSQSLPEQRRDQLCFRGQASGTLPFISSAQPASHQTAILGVRRGESLGLVAPNHSSRPRGPPTRSSS